MSLVFGSIRYLGAIQEPFLDRSNWYQSEDTTSATVVLRLKGSPHLSNHDRMLRWRRVLEDNLTCELFTLRIVHRSMQASYNFSPFYLLRRDAVWAYQGVEDAVLIETTGTMGLNKIGYGSLAAVLLDILNFL